MAAHESLKLVSLGSNPSSAISFLKGLPQKVSTTGAFALLAQWTRALAL